MGKQKWTRREMLGVSAGAMAGVVFAEPVKAAISPSAVTPELIEPNSLPATFPRMAVDKRFYRLDTDISA